MDVAGVTRDRLYADAEWLGREFTLIDTGGIRIGENEEMSAHIRKQAEIAVETANVVLYFVDGKTVLPPRTMKWRSCSERAVNRYCLW